MSIFMKNCTKCGERKPLDGFSPDRRARDGRFSECKVCHNARKRDRYCPTKRRRIDLRKRYGITPEEYDARLEAQGGLCAICRSDDPTKGFAHFTVDHCHETGVIRGLLCHTCNRVLGMFKDDVDRLRIAADYVEAAKCRA